MGLAGVACGGGGGSSQAATGGTTTTGAAATTGDTVSATDTPTVPGTAEPGGSGTSVAAGTSGPAAGGDGMTLTIHLNPAAVWDDGSPITSKDLECGWKANRHTPGSIQTAGYDKISSIDTSDAKTTVVHFTERYAAYKNLFSGSGGVIKADSVRTCDDISADFHDSIPFSGRPFKMESWSKDHLTLVPNDKYWVAADIPKAERVVMLPRTDSDIEISSLKSGDVSMIFPQAFPGIAPELNGPNIKLIPGYGTNYENLYFQQLHGPFEDPVFRKAFSESVDRNRIVKSIYEPIYPGAQLRQCAYWVRTIGKWCDNTQFSNSYNPDDAKKILTNAGWTRNGLRAMDRQERHRADHPLDDQHRQQAS